MFWGRLSIHTWDPFGPVMPVSPELPFSPLGPCGPESPGYPGGPEWPWGPRGPGGPCNWDKEEQSLKTNFAEILENTAEQFCYVMNARKFCKVLNKLGNCEWWHNPP